MQNTDTTNKTIINKPIPCIYGFTYDGIPLTQDYSEQIKHQTWSIFSSFTLTYADKKQAANRLKILIRFLASSGQPFDKSKFRIITYIPL